MDTLLSVYLYLNVVVSPGTYTLNQINQLAQQNAPQITAVENDPVLMNLVISEFYEEAEGITIIDNPAG